MGSGLLHVMIVVAGLLFFAFRNFSAIILLGNDIDLPQQQLLFKMCGKLLQDHSHSPLCIYTWILQLDNSQLTSNQEKVHTYRHVCVGGDGIACGWGNGISGF